MCKDSCLFMNIREEAVTFKTFSYDDYDIVTSYYCTLKNKEIKLEDFKDKEECSDYISFHGTPHDIMKDNLRALYYKLKK